MNISKICTFLKPKFRRSKALARLEFYSDSLMFGSRLSTYTTWLIRLPTQLGNQATINLLFKSQQFCPKNLGWQKQKKTILSVGYLNCSAAQMLLLITNLEDPFRTSLEVFFKKNLSNHTINFQENAFVELFQKKLHGKQNWRLFLHCFVRKIAKATMNKNKLARYLKQK